VTGSVRNEGTVAVAANSPATYSAGTFRNVAPGTITGGATLTLANTSTFFGTGSVTANIVNNGQFNAGQSPGALNINGTYTQNASGSLNVEIGGHIAGAEYDVIAISGTATLAGTLNVSLFGGFCEAGTFDVLTYPVVAGDFATKNGLSQGGLIFTATRNATFYRLNATGECVTAPIANNDASSVNEDGALSIAAPGVLANDTDPQHTPLTAVLFTGPSQGEVLLNPDGSFTYTPAADFFGTDSFSYVANDGSENSAPAAVTITVNAVNDPPNAVDDIATVDEDSGQNSVPVLANDETAPDGGETLTITAVTQGANGAVVITGGGSGLTYEPTANFSGIDTFSYTVSDGVFSAVATVSIQVTAINDPPEAVDDAAIVDEDSGASAINALTNDNTGGEAGDTLSIEAVSQGANGVVSISAGGTSVTYTPNPNFNGGDSFTYTITDGNGGTDTALVHVTVVSVNDPPDAQDDAVSAEEDSGVNQVDVLTNDSVAPDGNETLQVTAVSQAANGSVAISASGTSVIYTPGAEFSGTDSFTYTISDGHGGSDTATVTVVVTSVNDPPDAVDDTASVQEDSAANVIEVLANDSFSPDTGETLVITDVTQGINGTVTIDDGWITYTPNANFVGNDTFTYTISDGNGGADTATVTVTIANANDPPNADDDTANVDEDSGATSIDALANDSFAPDAGETLSITAVTQGANGSVAITGGGSGVTYTPHADFAGSDSFTYTLSDGNGGVDTGTVTVTVNGVNDAPDAIDDAATVNENSVTSINVLMNDGVAPDVGETLAVTAITQGAHGTVAIAGGGTAVTYAPAANFSGTDEFTYTVSDGHGGTDTATVHVTVRQINTTDEDNDGVPDNVDQCLGTPPGIVVNATGCAISQVCSAAATWKNHGEYVSCVSNTAAGFERLGLITAAERSSMVSTAAKSDVGKKK
jgi:large repetitive protein